MIQDLTVAYIDLLSENTWMTSETKNDVKAKVVFALFEIKLNSSFFPPKKVLFYSIYISVSEEHKFHFKLSS